MAGGNEKSSEASRPFNLTDLDVATLNMTDEKFVPDDWEALKRIVDDNALDTFRRYPSHLSRYIAFTKKTKAIWNNDMGAFVCMTRLHWTRLPNGGFEYVSSLPLADERDYKVLLNDWPYGFTPDIEHLVVWSKTPISVKPENGEVTAESAELIQKFVDQKFRASMVEVYGTEDGKDRVLWFKNWTKLQSMRAIEHFHVLVRGATKQQLAQWTDGDTRDESSLQDGTAT